MAYIEIKAIKAAAAVHRGIVNLAARSLVARDKRADKRLQRQQAYAADLDILAAKTVNHAHEVRVNADIDYTKDKLAINAATHTVLNLKDDLNKIG